MVFDDFQKLPVFNSTVLDFNLIQFTKNQFNLALGADLFWSNWKWYFNQKIYWFLLQFWISTLGWISRLQYKPMAFSIKRAFPIQNSSVKFTISMSENWIQLKQPWRLQMHSNSYRDLGKWMFFDQLPKTPHLCCGKLTFLMVCHIFWQFSKPPLFRWWKTIYWSTCGREWLMLVSSIIYVLFFNYECFVVLTSY